MNEEKLETPTVVHSPIQFQHTSDNKLISAVFKQTKSYEESIEAELTYFNAKIKNGKMRGNYHWKRKYKNL